MPVRTLVTLLLLCGACAAPSGPPAATTVARTDAATLAVTSSAATPPFTAAAAASPASPSTAPSATGPLATSASSAPWTPTSLATSASTPTSPSTPAPPAVFIVASPAGLLRLDASGRQTGVIAELPRFSSPSTPRLLPGRASVVFSLALIGEQGFGADIRAVNLGGTDMRTLIQHEAPNVIYDYPLPEPSGRFLFVHRRGPADGTSGAIDTVERLDLVSGQRVRILSDATEPTLSPDGTQIVYVRAVAGQHVALWRSASDGSGARAFFVIAVSWAYVQTPRFSPSGASVAFSATGRSLSRSTGGASASHLGIPGELDVAPIDGSAVRTVTLTPDDVAPEWSPDGTALGYVAAGALTMTRLADGTTVVAARADNLGFGDLLWLR